MYKREDGQTLTYTHSMSVCLLVVVLERKKNDIKNELKQTRPTFYFVLISTERGKDQHTDRQRVRESEREGPDDEVSENGEEVKRRQTNKQKFHEFTSVNVIMSKRKILFQLYSNINKKTMSTESDHDDGGGRHGHGYEDAGQIQAIRYLSLQ